MCPLPPRHPSHLSPHKNQKPSNLGEGRESDFQSYHIIILKCPCYQQQQKKYHETYKETGMLAHSIKNPHQWNCTREKTDGGPTVQRLFNNYHKDG